MRETTLAAPNTLAENVDEFVIEKQLNVAAVGQVRLAEGFESGAPAQVEHRCGSRLVIAVTELVGSEDREGVELRAGHVGLLVGGTARKSTLPTLDGWLKARLIPSKQARRAAESP